jgi:hypothetical protein
MSVFPAANTPGAWAEGGVGGEKAKVGFEFCGGGAVARSGGVVRMGRKYV